jgi:small subunit ribosomal protein S20
MPNTKSAGRRARNSARKNAQNRRTNSRLHSLESSYLTLASAGKKDEAAKALGAVTAALDKAAKTGTVPRSRANRKKSRLALHLNRVKAPAAPAA